MTLPPEVRKLLHPPFYACLPVVEDSRGREVTRAGRALRLSQYDDVANEAFAAWYASHVAAGASASEIASALNEACRHPISQHLDRCAACGFEYFGNTCKPCQCSHKGDSPLNPERYARERGEDRP